MRKKFEFWQLLLLHFYKKRFFVEERFFYGNDIVVALNRRQQALYKHRLNLWSVTRIINPTTNKASGEIYELVLEDVPCIYEYTPNVDVETAGRIKEFTLLTTDKIHMEASVPIKDEYITVN